MRQLLTKKNKIMSYQKNVVSYCVNDKGIKIPPYQSNYKTKKKTTIFSGNKNFWDVVGESLVFAVSTILISTFCAAIIILIINLLN
jgi:ABC-type Fe3+ transport system permease subunit